MRTPANQLRVLSKVSLAILATTALLSGAPGVTEAEAATISPDNPEAFKYWQSPDSPDREPYIEEPMPPGFQVIVSQFEGPVFADAEGRTLYKWPLRALRNGATGDREEKPSNCTNEVLKTSAGMMSPYPADLLLPDLDTRPSCTEVWPPVIPSEGAEEVGGWTIIERQDGVPQWAYGGYPLYTSILDKQPGDVNGGTKMASSSDGGVVRVPVGPSPGIPPDFEVIQSSTGRLLVNKDKHSVYAWDGDAPNTSNCHADCLLTWTPVPAPQNVVERYGWTVVERSPGINQWAFRGKPLYTYNHDRRTQSFWGADIEGWHNVYTQRDLPPPEGFTVQDVEAGGQVLADSKGRPIYLYNCRDDSLAQLACDNPDTTQAYRLAICGAGDQAVCRKNFPYVPAAPDAKSVSRLWSVMAIDPDTGHRASAGQAAIHVWAYRDRPVYTYSGDENRPGMTLGDGYGEFTGRRNGFKAFILRDVFQRNNFRR